MFSLTAGLMIIKEHLETDKSSGCIHFTIRSTLCKSTTANMATAQMFEMIFNKFYFMHDVNLRNLFFTIKQL